MLSEMFPSCCTEHLVHNFRITKPLTFADCVGDELPLGWEEVYDQQVGVYYIDHINSEHFSVSVINERAGSTVDRRGVLKLRAVPVLCGVN